MSSTKSYVVAVSLYAVTACGDASAEREPSTENVARGNVDLGASTQQIDWKAVEAAIGRPGVTQPDSVYRFNFPRGDLRVTADGVTIRPALALGGWLAMKAMPGGVMAMGDLVLTEDEVTPVMTRLQSGGVEQTAVHHHIVRESPRVLYMHIHGHGDAVKIAETIRAAVTLTKIPAPVPPSAAAGELGIDTSRVAQALGYAGRVNGGVYQVNVPRAETIRQGTFVVPPSMGLGSVMNFQPTGGGKAAITGDFVLIAHEVNPVIRALRDNGIEVTSLHSHLLMEEPRLFFMHFWANDNAEKLARGLRAALDKTNSRKSAP
ncbi:MAG: DUF1259 domain-containing protein [Gemmatimonadaceae bacterium]